MARAPDAGGVEHGSADRHAEGHGRARHHDAADRRRLDQARARLRTAAGAQEHPRPVSDAPLKLVYAFAPPAMVLVTTDEEHPVYNTLTLVITNRSGAAVTVGNPDLL